MTPLNFTRYRLRRKGFLRYLEVEVTDIKRRLHTKYKVQSIDEHKVMTSFAPPEIVRCPACSALAKRLSFASINLSGRLFPATFQAIARGDVCCPRCGAEFNATPLTAIARLDAPWKCGVWVGIPELWT